MTGVPGRKPTWMWWLALTALELSSMQLGAAIWANTYGGTPNVVWFAVSAGVTGLVNGICIVMLTRSAPPSA